MLFRSVSDSPFNGVFGQTIAVSNLGGSIIVVDVFETKRFDTVCGDGYRVLFCGVLRIYDVLSAVVEGGVFHKGYARTDAGQKNPGAKNQQQDFGCFTHTSFLLCSMSDDFFDENRQQAERCKCEWKKNNFTHVLHAPLRG